jgi:ATP-dependent RNA helicase RhlE
VPIGRQQRALAGGVDVLVATPGRLLDLVDQRSLTLQGVETLVLDEADQMLDLGFIHALRRVVTLVPKKRQTLFFSATMPKAIEALSAQFISDPVKVAVTPVATTAERVDQSVMFVSTGDKPALLRKVLADSSIDRVLVFTRTKHGADRVVKQLGQVGIVSAAIHGNKSQGQRERALGEFRTGRCRVLVATDIAARGIDVEGVSHVVNYDLPNVPESYVHRIGRTARAGATGQAISFCNGEERAYLRDIEKLTRLKVPVLPLPPGLSEARIEEPPRAQPERAHAGRPAQPQRHRESRGPHGHGHAHDGQNSAGPRNRGRRPGSQAQGHAQGHKEGAPAARPANGGAGRPRTGGEGRNAGEGRHGGEGRSMAWLDRAVRNPR